MPPTSSSVRIATGVRLPFLEHGARDGVPLLLLHGPTDSCRSFEPLLAHLPSALRALAPTQRGHGDADRPAGGYRPEDFARDALAFMDALDVASAVLVGHSGSTYTVQHMALERPDRILGLVLMAPPYGLPAKPAARELLQRLARLEDPVDPAFARDFVAGTVTRRLPPDFVETLVAECLKAPARVWRATLENLFASELPAEGGTIDAPTLVLWGDRDDVCPREDQLAVMRAIPGSRLEAYAGIGHSPHFEDPGRAARDIARFALEVGGLPPAPPRLSTRAKT